MGQRVVFAIPGDLAALTGGYGYDREVMARARAFGVEMEHLALPGGFPFPSHDDIMRAGDALRALDADAILLIDGLAFGAFTPDLLHALPRRTVALVHHPLALETGLSLEQAAHLRASERLALSRAAHVIVTSPSTKAVLASDYDMPAARIDVALPGVARAARARGSQDGPHLLAVGSVTPRKGHDVLVDALSGLVPLDWRLTIAGSLARAPDHAQALAAAIGRLGFTERVRLAGEVSDAELEELYASADVFVMPSHYEGYGMALGEAMARGLPIVATTGGAAAATAPDSAALKAAPGDVASLRAALSQALQDPGLRARLADASWAAGQALPTWDDTARIVAGVLVRMTEGGRA